MKLVSYKRLRRRRLDAVAYVALAKPSLTVAPSPRFKSLAIWNNDSTINTTKNVLRQ